jgi:DNA-binding NarL/FixJ family response regulator
MTTRWFGRREVREAVDEADRGRLDVVVMDVRLADGSGIEATREIRARHPKTHTTTPCTRA